MGYPRTRRDRSAEKVERATQAMPAEQVFRYPGTCTAVFGSMTQTLKAQNALAAASLRTAVTKVSSARTHGGCAYGLTFPCMQTENVREVLSAAGIRPRQLFGEGQP